MTQSNRTFRFCKALTALMAVMILLSGSGVAMASGAQMMEVHRLPITFEMNGISKQAPADQQGFIYQNRTYVPLRFVSEALQLQVEWDGAASTIHIRERLQTINNEQEEAASQQAASARTVERVTGYEREIEYHILGATVGSEQAPSGWIIEQRLYVPLRFLAETAGAAVHWDAKTYTAKILLPVGTEEETSKPQPVEKPEVTEPEPTKPVNPAPEEEPASPPASKPNPSEKSESAILRAAETQIERLRDSCEGDLWSLGLQYLNSDSENRKDLLAQGEAKLADCDRQFANIMVELEAELSKHGYETDAVAEYERLYEEEKAAARKLVDRLRG